MDEVIRQVVFEYLSGKGQIREIAPLYGDASYRRYFRVYLSGGGSVIVMKLPEGRSSVSEEITNYEGTTEELPYINISRYLKSISVDVPDILFHDKERSAIVLEDLGDRLFLNEVESGNNDTRLKWYSIAVEKLAFLKKSVLRDDSCIAFKRSFDERLLNWELDHFLEYGIEERTGKSVPPAVKKQFTEITRSISKDIVKMNYIFTHRDYQSRNLMIKDGRMYLLDFQDALLGPESYDLVSLLRDSYIEISDSILETLIGQYCDMMSVDMKCLVRDFDLVTIQRKLKDAGRFVYIDRVKGNPGYLPNIPTSLGYVKDAIFRHGKYTELYKLLKDFVPEWRDD